MVSAILHTHFVTRLNNPAMIFRNREDAAHQLAQKLQQYIQTNGVVLAVPRGGVPMGCIIARELHLPVDLLMTKKIGHPLNKEYAIGAVTLTDSFIIPHEDVSAGYIERETKRLRQNLQQMYAEYMGNQAPIPLAGKTVILVDDGIATGNTLMVTVKSLRKSGPEKIVIAVPVAPRLAIEKLSRAVDEIICLYTPEYFVGVGGFYENFGQVSDEEVKEWLARQQEDWQTT
jgi:predicted phosphoribosyltransferase